MPEPGSDDIPAVGIAELAELIGRLGQVSDDLHADDGAALLDALEILRQVRERAAALEPSLIRAARAAGVSWARLAPAMGVTSRQAAERRYLRLSPTPSGDTTAEGRVRAVRSRRAGQRAVTAWARANAAELRQLAAAISTTDGLTGEAKRHAAHLAAALADDDPATLLPLLEDAGPHLRAEHGKLAARVDTFSQAAQHHHDAAADAYESKRR